MNITLDPNHLKGTLDLILLSILADGAMYGLEIIGEAQSRTQGFFDFKEGSLYPALHRLEAQQLLKSELRESDLGGPRRKYYALTEAGIRALAQKQQQWQAFTGAVAALEPKS
jgi:PadR family transcriptional regulator, regulatory protein PadR